MQGVERDLSVLSDHYPLANALGSSHLMKMRWGQPWERQKNRVEFYKRLQLRKLCLKAKAQI